MSAKHTHRLTPNVVHLPRPQTHDPQTIFDGRMRALRQYSDAQSALDRFEALIWANHWRRLDEHAKALRDNGL